MMTGAKIIATLGPASDTPDVVGDLYEAGMDVARVNLSHGDRRDHRRAAALVRGVQASARQVTGRPLALMLDTRGPEIRVTGPATPLDVSRGVLLQILDPGGAQEGQHPDRITVSVSGLHQRVVPGTRISIRDGQIGLEVEEVGRDHMWARVLNPGTIARNDKIAFPGIRLDLPFLSGKDRGDLQLAVDMDVDWVALSLVQDAANILEVRDFLCEQGGDDLALVAKIETLGGYQNLESILLVADAVMIARGDLVVDFAPEEIPLVQKDIILRCNRAGIPVITATQMLESMITSPVPTRAEASDVANAIMDGTDAVMLSGETAIGQYPVEAVGVMARIVQKMEIQRTRSATWRDHSEPDSAHTITDAVAGAAVRIADELAAEAILTPTQSGHTARRVARYRPGVPIIAATTSEKRLRQLALVWGVRPLIGTSSVDPAGRAAEDALAAGLLHPGDLVVVTSGAPGGLPGTTDTVHVTILGTVLLRGSGIGRASAVGRACVEVDDAEQLQPPPSADDILVLKTWKAKFAGFAHLALAIICEEAGLSSPAALVGLDLQVPVVVDAQGATQRIKPGETITVDAARGVVYTGKASLGGQKNP